MNTPGIFFACEEATAPGISSYYKRYRVAGRCTNLDVLLSAQPLRVDHQVCERELSQRHAGGGTQVHRQAPQVVRLVALRPNDGENSAEDEAAAV